MRTLQQIVAENLGRVRERIANAAMAAARSPAEVRLVAVTKYVDAATTLALLEAGCHDLGESRPQQLWEKSAAPELAGARWHLVGRLQRNKVRRTLQVAALVHSVDSRRLLAALDEHARELERPPRVLLEVNCSGEAAKQGFSIDEVRDAAGELSRYEHIVVDGLMTMAPLEGGEAAARQTFAALRRLRDSLRGVAASNAPLRELSMGMSGDFEQGILEGATIVRIGSALFEGI